MTANSRNIVNSIFRLADQFPCNVIGDDCISNPGVLFINIISSYILCREQMTNLFVLVDSRHEPQKIDMEFIEWLGENGIPFSIVFTKADKSKPTKLKANIDAYLKALKEQWEELPPYFITSSENKTGRTELLNYIESINKSL